MAAKNYFPRAEVHPNGFSSAWKTSYPIAVSRNNFLGTVKKRFLFKSCVISVEYLLG